jgi:hypothetical protein
LLTVTHINHFAKQRVGLLSGRWFVSHQTARVLASFQHGCWYQEIQLVNTLGGEKLKPYRCSKVHELEEMPIII